MPVSVTKASKQLPMKQPRGQAKGLWCHSHLLPGSGRLQGVLCLHLLQLCWEQQPTALLTAKPVQTDLNHTKTLSTHSFVCTLLHWFGNQYSWPGKLLLQTYLWHSEVVFLLMWWYSYKCSSNAMLFYYILWRDVVFHSKPVQKHKRWVPYLYLHLLFIL